MVTIEDEQGGMLDLDLMKQWFCEICKKKLMTFSVYNYNHMIRFVCEPCIEELKQIEKKNQEEVSE
jgi:hypothetical protein